MSNTGLHKILVFQQKLAQNRAGARQAPQIISSQPGTASGPPNLISFVQASASLHTSIMIIIEMYSRRYIKYTLVAAFLLLLGSQPIHTSTFLDSMDNQFSTRACKWLFGLYTGFNFPPLKIQVVKFIP